MSFKRRNHDFMFLISCHDIFLLYQVMSNFDSRHFKTFHFLNLKKYFFLLSVFVSKRL